MKKHYPSTTSSSNDCQHDYIIGDNYGSECQKCGKYWHIWEGIDEGIEEEEVNDY